MLLEHLLFPKTFLSRKKLRQAVEAKTIVITGASFGIGEALTHLLADYPVHLILVARTAEKLKAIQTSLQNQAATIDIFPCNLTDKTALEALIVELHQFPKIDFVVSNAGHSIMRSIHQSLDRLHDFERTMKINYLAPVQLLLGLIPMLKKSQGHIINISAVNVLLIPAPYWAAYQASKTAFDQWFRAAMPELNQYKITCSSIYLPLVRTRMIAPTKAYAKTPAMQPTHVARLIAKILYTKRRKHQPWWLFFGILASVIFRPLWEFFVPFFLKRR